MAATKAKKIKAKDLYTELEMDMKEFKELASTVGIEVKAWNTSLSGDEASAIRKAAGGGLEAVAEEIGYGLDSLEEVCGVLGIGLEGIESADELKDADVARLKASSEAVGLAKELDVSFEEIRRLASKIGIEIGSIGFKGLSRPETLLLRAQYRTKHGGANKNVVKEASEVEEPKFAAPTGNKAEEERRKEEQAQQRQQRSERRGSGQRSGGTGGDKPAAQDNRSTAPHKVGSGGRYDRKGPQRPQRSGRKRFEVKESNYASQRKGGRRGDEDDQPKKPEMPTGPVTVDIPINLRGLSEALGVKVNDIMGMLMREGMMVKITDSLSEEMIENIGIIVGREITVNAPKSAEELIESELEKFEDDVENKLPRAPVVTIMGHVDHGKTSLLDAINNLDRASQEAGGITQHIGAFRVEVEREDADPMEVAFIDTPGHEAFTEMRARGANVTDIAVIVVAADDAVMPQTEEAINHARAAGVEIVVAINKIDKPDANVQRTRQALATHNLMSPDWGGSTEIVEVSAITGQGVKQLIETISDVAEILELRATPEKPAVGTVLEAHRSEGRGIIATVLVQDGTLRKGQAIVAGMGYGKVRAMYNSLGQQVEEAGPSYPVQVTGLSELPEAGSRFHGVRELKKATQIATKVTLQEKELARARANKPMTLEAWSQSKAANEDISELLLVLKADAQGTCETIKSELGKFSHEEVGIRIIHSAVGTITTNDVRLAEASGAVLIGFNTGVQPTAQELADEHHVDIRLYDVIYKLLEDIQDALAGLLKPEEVEVETGLVEVRKTFKASKLGVIAGCYVTEGVVPRNAYIRVFRDDELIYNGRIDSLRRFQDEVKEVREGFECGIVLRSFNDIQEGDIMRAFVVETRERTLN